MKIICEYPPNIEEIKKYFPINGNVVFTYGDKLYSPAGLNIDKPLMTHEETHSRQQIAWGIEAWWKRYLVDKKFRLSQELEAYTNQYKEFCRLKKDISKRAIFLARICQDISSPLYGEIISYEEAVYMLNRNLI